MKPYQLAIAALAVVSTIGLHVSEARANCARPKDYSTKLQGNTVTVCAQTACETAGTLLREDVATGTVVELSNCEASDAGSDPACWVDECVPEGTYRYGLKSPYSCCSGCCGTYYYGSGMGSAETKVTTPLGSCTPSGDAPAPYAGNVPWNGKSQTICQYKNPWDAGAGGSTNGTGGTLNAAGGSNSGVGGSGGTADDSQADPGDDSGGCSLSGGGLNRTVLGIHALALMLGLVFVGRSRARRA